MLAAAKAEAFWNAYADKDFSQQIDHVCSIYIPDFGIAATVIIIQLRECRTTLLLELNREEGDRFAMTAEMGLFEQRNASGKRSNTRRSKNTAQSKFAQPTTQGMIISA